MNIELCSLKADLKLIIHLFRRDAPCRGPVQKGHSKGAPLRVDFQHAGFILITTLLFVFIITLLILSSLQNSLLHNKLTAYQEQSMQLLQMANRTLKKVENELITDDLTVQDFSVDIAHASDAWWEQHANQIHADDLNAWYYIDELSTTPCIKIQNEKIAGVIFYRLTVKSIGNQNDQLLLQAVYAKAKQLPETCSKTIITIQPAQQSWHVLNE